MLGLLCLCLSASGQSHNLRNATGAWISGGYAPTWQVTPQATGQGEAELVFGPLLGGGISHRMHLGTRVGLIAEAGLFSGSFAMRWSGCTDHFGIWASPDERFVQFPPTRFTMGSLQLGASCLLRKRERWSLAATGSVGWRSIRVSDAFSVSDTLPNGSASEQVRFSYTFQGDRPGLVVIQVGVELLRPTRMQSMWTIGLRLGSMVGAQALEADYEVNCSQGVVHVGSRSASIIPWAEFQVGHVFYWRIRP